MRVLIFADYFLPGSRAGGPIRSLANFVREYQAEHEIYLVTRDRDSGDQASYRSIELGNWNSVAGISVRYLSPQEMNAVSVRSLMETVSPDVVYLNSLFSPLTRWVLRLRASKQIPSVSTLLAVRGELHPSALKQKSVRKRLYLRLSQLLHWYQGISFHASTIEEQAFIQRCFPRYPVGVAMNIPEQVVTKPKEAPVRRPHFVFISRVSPVKNLEVFLGAIEQLQSTQVGFNATFSIHGGSVQEDYVKGIQGWVDRLGPNVNYWGPFQHDEVWGILDGASFSVLPSRGENFGHSIYESMAAGVPVLISDQTPWTQAVKDGAGWGVSVDDIEGWSAAILEAIEMTSACYRDYSENCRQQALRIRRQAIREHHELLKRIL